MDIVISHPKKYTGKNSEKRSVTKPAITERALKTIPFPVVDEPDATKEF